MEKRSLSRCTRAFVWTLLIGICGLSLHHIVKTLDERRTEKLEAIQETVERAEKSIARATSDSEREIATARLSAALEAMHELK